MNPKFRLKLLIGCTIVILVVLGLDIYKGYVFGGIVAVASLLFYVPQYIDTIRKLRKDT